MFFEKIKDFMLFSGRARRREFWVYALIYFLIFILIIVLANMTGGIETITSYVETENGFSYRSSTSFLSSSPFYYVMMIFILGTLIPSLAVTVRRLHDTGRSGAWFFINFIPIIGNIIFLVFVCLDSQPGGNHYGPNPKTGETVIYNPQN